MNEFLLGKRVQAVIDAVLVHASGSCDAGARASLRAMPDRSVLRAELKRLGLESEFESWLSTQPDALRAESASSGPESCRP